MLALWRKGKPTTKPAGAYAGLQRIWETEVQKHSLPCLFRRSLKYVKLFVLVGPSSQLWVKPSCQWCCLLKGKWNVTFWWTWKKDEGVNLDSRRILFPPWYLFWGFCQPFLLQLSCQITHSLGSPKCFSIPGVSDGWGRTICHLKWKF